MQILLRINLLNLALIAGAIGLAGNAFGTDLDLARNPLLVTGNVDPNIMFLIDNSGSMSNIVPDEPFVGDTQYFTCPASLRISTTAGQIEVRITGGGDPSFHVSNTNHDWGTSGNNSERCFDSSQSYTARLFGNDGGAGATKSPSGYLQAEYTGNYLNWYFGSSPTNWGADARKKPGTEQRMEIAKSAATNLVSTLNDARVGLASYNGSNGATINVGVNDLSATQKSALTSAISGLTPSGATPLAESLQGIGRYFVGEANPQYDGNLTLHPGTPGSTIKDDDTVFDQSQSQSPNYASGVSQASPIQYYCQQNFAVLLTDGRPQDDRDIASTTGLRDYDGDCASVTPACNSDDRKPNRTYESSGSDYLDDIASALFDMDLRPDLDDTQGNEVKNNIITYTIGFADDQVINDPLMQDTADNGGGQFLQAANAGQLTAAFLAATDDIFDKVQSSVSSVAFNSGTVRAGSQLYQAKFVSQDWAGSLLALSLHDGSGGGGCTVSDPVGKICPTPVWDASCVLTGGACASTGTTVASVNLGTARHILTYKPSTHAGIALDWAVLDTAQKDKLRTNSSATLDNEATGKARLGYLRGDRGCEQGSTASCNYTEGATTFTGKNFRDRISVLGDIVHGSPVYVSQPYRRYPGTWLDNLGGGVQENSASTEYSAFKLAYSNRMRMVYTAANDGLLHAFRSGKLSSGSIVDNDGKELLAYMPTKALEKAARLTDANYSHDFFVDGGLTENDVFFAEDDDAWHTILVGGLGSGGQGIYALNITNPDLSGKPDSDFSESNAGDLALWEFTDQDDAGLGYTIGKPVIVRLHNGQWAVIVGNGYNNTVADGSASGTGNAALYILFVEGPGADGIWDHGSEYIKLDTGVGTAQDPTGGGRPNGLATVFPVDKDADFITDYIYAGDLFGNVWRFDLTATSSIVSNWTVADYGSGSPKPLFTAVDGNSNVQPITTQVQVGEHPSGVNHGVMVYFGTGKYFETGDQTANTSTTQTFYGIWDNHFSGVGASINVVAGLPDPGGTNSYVERSNTHLVPQQINAVGNESGYAFRRVTNNTVDWSSRYGWYIDLKLSSGTNQGEMVMVDPVLRGKAVIFNTLIPSTNPCLTGGNGFIMIVDRATGGRLQKSPFDVNNDHVFTNVDLINFGGGDEIASGISIAAGTPGFTLKDGGLDVMIESAFDGTIEQGNVDLGFQPPGRKTWRQLR